MDRQVIEEIKDRLMLEKVVLQNEVKFSDPDAGSRLLSTGSTTLNLACTGRLEGGFAPGRYYFMVGDSSSGKTFLSMTCFAEAAKNPFYDNYRFIYDGPENGALMDIERFFGKRVKERLEPASFDEAGNPKPSYTVQEFYYNVDSWLKDGRPFIAILDSQDCLSSDEEILKFEEQKQAFLKGKVTSGSYGDGKARLHSSKLRKLMGPLSETGSILIILNQSRSSFNPFEQDTYSGGRALLFYATLQLWSTNAGSISKVVRGKERQLGIFSKVRVKKNRVTGRDRTVRIRIYHSFGIDDVGSMVDYLIAEKVWKETNGMVEVTGLGAPFKGRVEKVFEKIEDENLVDDLKLLVSQTWNEIEDSCKVNRRSRYV